MHFPLAARRWAFVGFGALLALSGCGDGRRGEVLGEDEGPLGALPDTAFANDKTAYDYFVGKGLTNYQAAGIVGNLDQESGVDPNAVEAGGPGRGIAQWSVGGRWDTDANDNAMEYASSQGQSVDSLQLQLAFIWYELTTFSSYGLAALQATTNVTDATVTFETDFEGCSQCDESTRIAYAQSVLSAYGASSGPPDAGVEAGAMDAGGSSSDAGGHAPDAGGPKPDAGGPAPGDSGSPGLDDSGSPVLADSGGGTGAGHDAGDAGWYNAATSKSGGCSVGSSPGGAPPWTAGLGGALVLGAMARSRRRSSRRASPRHA